MLKKVTIPPARPKRAKTRSFPSKAAGEESAGGVLDLTHPAPGRPRPALFPCGYVEDAFESRMKLRVGARLGLGGWNIAFFSILLRGATDAEVLPPIRWWRRIRFHSRLF